MGLDNCAKGKVPLLMNSFLGLLSWLDVVILWGYYPTLKLSGILTFLTYSMDNI